jgi:uncharacterized protein YyaL (SSP411 family)
VAAHQNRLSRETSPYLLQHQHNPVDWYPWGPEAFERARRVNRPIFLSVGYSTCYWCHVMERQSFESEAVAAEMNSRFVCIKVDREERPDVDQLYMTAVQVLTQRGGWPMSVWLTPDLRPFYGGTYYPPQQFVQVLHGLEDAWRNRRAEVEKAADQITGVLRQLAQPPAPRQALTVDDALVESIVERTVADYDPRHGGFGGAPKFPRETELELLLARNARFPDERRLRMLRHTLDAMADGGIRDQLGGGFHRYSTDARWLVPHFEIMLYDNAMLAYVYAEAYRQTGEPRYARVAREVLDFVLREMTAPDGSFYTAFDAEVDSQEGLNYLWTQDEVNALLPPDDAALFSRVYGLDRGPNFADPHHGTGVADKNVLFLPEPLAAVAASLGVDEGVLRDRLAPMKESLLRARAGRKQPLLDTKVLTSWDALMIRAFAYGYQVLNDPRYRDAAERGARFLLERHRGPGGTLYRTSREGGPPKCAAFLDDYAFLAQALLALHDATGDAAWRDRAADVAAAMTTRFSDAEQGGLFFTDASADDLVVRQKVGADSPLPSGNAVAAMALLALGRSEEARRILAAFAQSMVQQGEGMSAMLQAATLHLARDGAFRVSLEEEAPARPASAADAAKEAVNVTAEWASPTELHVRLRVAPPWHVYAHDPCAADVSLVPTQLHVDAGGADVTLVYPRGRDATFEFVDRPVRVYDGAVTIVARFAAPPSAPPRVSITYQACDDRACLAPVTRPVPVAPSR